MQILACKNTITNVPSQDDSNLQSALDTTTFETSNNNFFLQAPLQDNNRCERFQQQQQQHLHFEHRSLKACRIQIFTPLPLLSGENMRTQWTEAEEEKCARLP